VGLSHAALSELQFLEGPPLAGFLFVTSSDFLRIVVNTQWPDPESGLAIGKVSMKNRHAASERRRAVDDAAAIGRANQA
jgi:hypothetical protein